MNKIFITSAPSGAGKTSLTRALVKKLDSLAITVSHTTRPKREGEINGKDYYFVTETEFAKLQKENAFIETAKVFKHHYGTSKMAIDKILTEGKNVILEIDWQGARQVRSLYPNQQTSIFILPPSLQALEDRLIERGQDDAKTIAYRLEQAQAEMSHANEFNYKIINDNFNKTLNQLIKIVSI